MSNESSHLNVVQFPNDAAILQPTVMLRKIADAIEAGEHGNIGCVAVVIAGNRLEVCAAGIASDSSYTIATLHAGAHWMVRQLVDAIAPPG